MTSDVRVAEYTGALGVLDIVTREPPVPGVGEVLIEVAACAVCRTDLQIVDGDLAANQLPVVPGHQIVGRVVAAGAASVIEVGTVVGVAWLAAACGACTFCLGGRENLCSAARFTGWDRDGGYGSHVVADGRFVYPLPPDVSPVAVAPLLCGGAIGLRSLRISGIEPDQRLGLFGFGASATIVLQIARRWGCEVYVTARGEADRRRALDLGAAWAGPHDAKPPEPLHAAITTAPVGTIVVDALRAVQPGGTVAINAIHLDEVPAFPYELLWGERSLRSVANVARRDVLELLDLAAAEPFETVIERYALGDVNVALSDLRSGTLHGAAVIVP